MAIPGGASPPQPVAIDGASSRLVPTASLPRAGVVRERLEAAKNAAIGRELGKSDSWAQKVIEGHSGVLLDDIPRLLAALGLKVVDVGVATVDPAVFEAYRSIARAALSDPGALTTTGAG